tara:strand:+ start:23 stop:2353 length:2331 start_codon:yes stop_codon:yes gene_type:complete
MLTAKQAQTAEKRQLDMAARQAALAGAQTDLAAEHAIALKKAGLTDKVTKPQSLFKVVPNKDGQPVLLSIGTFDLNNKNPDAPKGLAAYNDAFELGVMDEKGADDFRALLMDESGQERTLMVALADGKTKDGSVVNKGDVLTGTPRELKASFGAISYGPVPANALTSFTQLFKVTYDENNFAVPEMKSVVQLDAVNNIASYESKGYSTDRAFYDQAIATNARLDEAAEKVETINLVRKNTSTGEFDSLSFNTFDNPRAAAAEVSEKLEAAAEEGFGPWKLQKDSIAFGNALAEAKAFASASGRLAAEEKGDLVEIGLSDIVTVGDKTFTPDDRGVVTISKADLKNLYNSDASIGVVINLNPSYVTDQDVFHKFGYKTMAEFEALEPETKLRLQGLAPRYKVDKIDTADGTLLVRTNIDTGEQLDLSTYDPVAEGDWFTLTYTNKIGQVISTIQDISTASGKAVLKIVDEQNTRRKGSASMQRVGTERVNPQAYLTESGQIVTSYDSKTFVDPATRKVRLLTEVNANTLGQSDISKMLKKDQLSVYAENLLKDILGLDDTHGLGAMDDAVVYETVDENGQEVTLPDHTQQALTKFIEAQLKNLSSIKTTTKDIEQGVGFVSNVFAALNNVGGTLKPEAFNEIFGKNAEARAAVERFGIAALSALSPNPGLRLSNEQMNLVKKLLPSSTDLFVNTKTEGGKFQNLVRMMQSHRINLLKEIRQKNPNIFASEGAIKATLGKLTELNNILRIVRIDDGQAPLSLGNALDITQDALGETDP